MNLYLDTSALTKQYIREQGTEEVNRWIARADIAATSLITLAEANTAFGRAARMHIVTGQTAEEAVRLLFDQWAYYFKTPVSEKTVTRAAELAWTLGLRGYDAVHLASAELWQSALVNQVLMVTFDRQLAVGSRRIGMSVLPE